MCVWICVSVWVLRLWCVLSMHCVNAYMVCMFLVCVAEVSIVCYFQSMCSVYIACTLMKILCILYVCLLFVFWVYNISVLYICNMSLLCKWVCCVHWYGVCSIYSISDECMQSKVWVLCSSSVASIVYVWWVYIVYVSCIVCFVCCVWYMFCECV